MKHRRLIFSVFLVGAVLVTFAWAHEGHKAITVKGVSWDKDGNLQLEPPTRKAVGLKLEPVDFHTIEQTLAVNARVVLPWDKQAFASSRIEGIIEMIYVDPGDTVAAGDTLAKVQSLELENLQLELLQRAIELELVSKNLKRVRELGTSIISGKDIQKLESESALRMSALENIKRRLSAVGLSQEQIDAVARTGETVNSLPIKSPVGGVVVHVDVSIGRHVEPTEHLFEINDLSVVWIEGQVPEKFIGRVQRGQTATASLSAYPGRSWPGTIDNLYMNIEAGDRVRHVLMRVENPGGRLKPGMFGQLIIVTAVSRDAIAAPRRGIIIDGAERYALVQQKEGVYKKVPVVLGLSDGRWVDVLEGLYPGDSIVVDGGHELSELYVQGTLTVSDEARKNMRYRSEEVDLRTIDDVIRLNARLELSPRANGIASTRIDGKIEEISVILGQRVKKGEPLARVHSLELEGTQLELIQAHLKGTLLNRQLERLRRLSKDGISSLKEVIRVESEVRRQVSLIQSLRRRLRVMGLADEELDRIVETRDTVRTIEVVAPIDGIIADNIGVVLGKVVHMGEHLFLIWDLSKIWVEGALFEGDLAQVLDGSGVPKRVQVRPVATSGRTWESTISHTNQAFSGGENTLEVWVTLENADGLLLPGMQAELLIEVGRSEDEVIALPAAALIRIGRKEYAFVEQGEGFRRVEVDVGRRGSRYVEALKGIYPGDRVVVSGVIEMNNALSAVR